MAGLLITQGFQVLQAGQPVPAARVFFFEDLTTTPKAVFLDAALTIPAPNPSICDVNGFVNPPVFLQDTPYRVESRTLAGSVIETRDGVIGLNSTGAAVGSPGTSVFRTYNEAPLGSPPATPTVGGQNSNGWSTMPTSNANWISEASGSDINLVTWSPPIQLVGNDGVDGTNGVDGSTGNQIEFRFRRSTTQPSTPTGDNPSGWWAFPNSATGPGFLWMSRVEKNALGQAEGNWSVPVQIEGESGQQFIFRRSATQPATPTGNPIPSGWFDSADQPPGTEKLWVSTAFTDGNGDLLGSWAVPTQINADPSFSVELSNQSVNINVDSGGNGNFGAATGEVTVTAGASDATANSTFRLVQAIGCTGQVNTTDNEFFTGDAGSYRVTAIDAAGSTGELQIGVTPPDGVEVIKKFTVQTTVQTDQPLTAVISFGNLFSNVANGTQNTPQTRTCEAAGGDAPYTYQWTRVSGDTQITAVASTSATTSFQSTGTNQLRQAVFRCDVTDDFAPPNVVQSNTITVSVNHGVG
ncbi:MAG: hypothetical protein AAFN78_00995 [Pseudomonadota bacterium]